MTFNHHAYIEDAMNGFVMQKTDFPFVCVIVDDASTDGEPEVIKKYFQTNFDLTENTETDDYVMTFGQHKTNKNCYFAVLYLKYNHYSIKKDKTPYYSKWQDNSKYIALCEGDDYWIAAEKLQRQADFLEKNEDYVLCHTDFEATKKRHFHYKEIYKDGNYFPSMLKKNFSIGTLTVMIRTDSYKKIPKYFIGKGWPMTDKPLWYELAYIGKFTYIPLITAMYRILQESASHSKNIKKLIYFKNAGLEIKRFYAKKYGIMLKNDGYTPNYYTNLLKYAYDLKEFDIAKKIYREARKKNLLSIKGYIYYWGTKNKYLRKIISKILN
ncbi:MAG: hypothetical protein IKQ46_05975 [Bacteroidales bacterium]|nr:hypothetical protein [Bacteroidales bacterium]